jgi:hypothetical protein
VRKTSTAPKLAVVEEEPAPVEVEKCSKSTIDKLWTEILVSAGAKPQHYSRQRRIFIESYDEECSLSAVHAAMVSFFKEYDADHVINKLLGPSNVS